MSGNGLRAAVRRNRENRHKEVKRAPLAAARCYQQ